MGVDPVDRDRAKELRAQGWCVRDIADEFGCTVPAITHHLNYVPTEHQGVGRVDPVRAKELRADGRSLQEIASVFGVTKAAVSRHVQGVAVEPPPPAVRFTPRSAPPCGCPDPMIDALERTCWKCGRAGR